MKRLSVPLLICVLLTTAGTAVSLETDVDADPAAESASVEERLQALEEKITQLELESSRQKMLIERQAETIRKLEQSPAYSAFPTFYTPQKSVPFHPLPNTQSPVPQHPSTGIPNMPKGTRQHWINGMPFYIVPCSTSEPVAQTGTNSVVPKIDAVFQNAAGGPVLTGAVVLPDESLGDAR